MARRTKENDPDLSLVESTGNVEFDGTPVTVEQPAENKSTDAVEYVAPGTTEVEHYGADVVVRAETPGPVTVSFPGLPGVQDKVIRPPEPTDDAPPADATGDQPPVEEAPADQPPAGDAPPATE